MEIALLSELKLSRCQRIPSAMLKKPVMTGPNVLVIVCFGMVNVLKLGFANVDLIGSHLNNNSLSGQIPPELGNATYAVHM